MNHLSLEGFYRTTLYKYTRFRRRLNKSITSGQFYRYSRKKQIELLRRVDKLRKKLSTLSTQLKLAGATATLALLLNSNSVQAQSGIGPFYERKSENPLRPPIYANNYNSPFLVDFDKDGDLDLFEGTRYEVHYFINRGTNNKAFFDEPTAGENPLQGVTWPYEFDYTSPVLANLDADADLEMVVSNNYGSLFYFDIVNGKFVDKSEEPNPISNIVLPNNYYTRAKLTLADLDGDGDLDLYVGLYDYLLDEFTILESKNNNNIFDPATEPAWATDIKAANIDYLSPTFGDLDGDGDLDLVIGDDDGSLYYFRNASKSSIGGPAGPIEFVLGTGPWVPGTGGENPTGNPFENYAIDKYASPAMADMDGDGDLDIVVGFNYDYYYSDNDERSISYLENTGINNAKPFVERFDLEDPFGGVDTGNRADITIGNLLKDAPPSVMIGGLTYSYYYGTSHELYLYTYQSEIDEFRNKSEQLGTEFPFGEDNAPQNASPIFVDLDNDGDSDLVLGQSGFESKLQYFLNNNGIFEEKTGSENPFIDIAEPYQNYSASFGDLDGDGLKDMIVTDQYNITYYKNTGTASAPAFEQTDIPGDINPDNDYYFYGTARTVMIDLDHDGDLDVVLGKYGVWYFENIGNANEPNFVLYYPGNTGNPFGVVNEHYDDYQSPAFMDVDKDGDMDLLVGNDNGQISYYKNQNPAPLININQGILKYGSQPVIVDGELTLIDQDEDMIVSATVQVLNYKAGDDLLSVTTQSPVTGNFNSTTGVLTLQGKAPVSVYQSILRSVMYEYTGSLSNGRKGGKTSASNKRIEFKVYDVDSTAPIPQVRTIFAPSPNQPPTIATNKLSTVIGGRVEIVLADIISDPDGNLDPNSFEIIRNVSPTPPTIGNASIANGILSIDYTELSFTGTDFVTINACDFDGLCSAAQITIEVAGDVIVYNGMSPNSDGRNDFFRLEHITALAPENKVSIFNRWGDKVFEIENYDNLERKFDGRSDDGKDLSSGIYYYKIEFTNGKAEMTGYLTLKR